MHDRRSTNSYCSVLNLLVRVLKYSFSDDRKTGYGWLSDGTRFLFDAEDFEKIRDINWYRNLNNGDTRRLYITTQSGVYLHRYIIPDVPSGYEVDHISLDTLDNRKCNLRVCTHQQNQCNESLDYATPDAVYYASFRVAWCTHKRKRK